MKPGEQPHVLVLLWTVKGAVQAVQTPVSLVQLVQLAGQFKHFEPSKYCFEAQVTHYWVLKLMLPLAQLQLLFANFVQFVLHVVHELALEHLAQPVEQLTHFFYVECQKVAPVQ